LFFGAANPQEFSMKLLQRAALGCAFAATFLSISTTAFAGTGEFCSIPNAAGTAVSYECSVKYLPTTANWLTKFKTWMGTNQTTGAMACFGPGTYNLPSTSATATDTSVDTNRLVLRNVQNMKLCAPTGSAIFEHKTVNATATPLTTTVYWPTLHIATSSGVSIKGMEFRNKTEYVSTTEHQVTRAVWADRSADSRLFDSKASGLGKQVVIATDASVGLSGATVACAYFCIAGERGAGAVKPAFAVTNSQFTINHAKVLADEHTAIWMDNTDFTISDSSFNFITGQGFVSGTGTTVDWVNLSNISITGTNSQGGPKMFGWIGMNPSYTNLQINYTGATPFSQYGRAYFCNGYLNAACESGFETAGNGGSVFRYRANTSSAYVTAPLPPTRTKKILFINGGGTDTAWAQALIALNKLYLLWPLAQQWPALGTALGGWLDVGDQVLTGDFLVADQPRTLFFNSETLGGAISVRALGGTGSVGTMTTEAWIDWTPALAANLGGWHDANDKLLAGDFTGLGRAQLLFMNVDGAGGAFYMAAIDGANSQLQSLAGIPWSAALSTSLAGWMDANDKLVAGDFTGSGRAQLLFLNTDGGAQGAASLRQYDAASNAFQIVGTVPWNKVVGTNAAIWQQASAKALTGDFIGLGKDQLMFINPTGSGVAISIWAFDSALGSFSEVHKMNYAASEMPSLNGLVESNDWQLGF
jgi:hypothetical protein